MTTPTRHIVTATEAREILRDPTREHVAGQTTSLAYTVIALSEQITDVLALHQPVPDQFNEEPWCNSCEDETYPCSTARALKANL
jgi:hypothetical protein